MHLCPFEMHLGDGMRFAGGEDDALDILQDRFRGLDFAKSEEKAGADGTPVAKGFTESAAFLDKVAGFVKMIALKRNQGKGDIEQANGGKTR